MAYEITLDDSTDTWVSPSPNTPLTMSTIAATSQVTTLNLNVYVDLMDTKRLWTVRWGYMSAANYAQLRAFYDRQFTAMEFPSLSIPDTGVSNIITYIDISDQNITDGSGLVENVELTLRETIQSTPNYFVS